MYVTNIVTSLKDAAAAAANNNNNNNNNNNGQHSVDSPQKIRRTMNIAHYKESATV
jgi:hypothetical protein